MQVQNPDPKKKINLQSAAITDPQPLKIRSKYFQNQPIPLPSIQSPSYDITCQGGAKNHTKQSCFHTTCTRQGFTAIHY